MAAVTQVEGDFFTLRVVVEDSALSIILDRLEGLVGVKVNRRVASYSKRAWVITCYGSEYSALDALKQWHRDNEIEEFHVY